MALPLAALLGGVGRAAGGAARAGGGASNIFSKISPQIQGTRRQLTAATQQQQQFNNLLQQQPPDSEGYNLLSSAVNGADAKVASLTDKLNKQIAKVQQITAAFGKAGKVIGVAIGAVAGFATAIAGLALKLGGTAEQLRRVEYSTGMSTIEIQELTSGMEQLGISLPIAALDKFAAAQRNVLTTLQYTGQINDQVIIAYAKLGIPLGETAQASEDLYNRLNNLPLGEAEYFASLAGVPAAFIEARKAGLSYQEAQQRGLAMTEAEQKQQMEAARSLRRMGQIITNTGGKLATVFMPYVERAAEVIGEFGTKIAAFIDKNKDKINAVIDGVRGVAVTIKDIIVFIKNNWQWLSAPFQPMLKILQFIWPVVKGVGSAVYGLIKGVVKSVDWLLKQADKLGLINYTPFESTFERSAQERKVELETEVPEAVKLGVTESLDSYFDKLADIDARRANKYDSYLIRGFAREEAPPPLPQQNYERYTHETRVMNAEELRRKEQAMQLPDYFAGKPEAMQQSLAFGGHAPAPSGNQQMQNWLQSDNATMREFAERIIERDKPVINALQPSIQGAMPVAPVRTIAAPEDAIKASYPGQSTSIINNNTTNYNTTQENSLNFNNDGSPADTAGEVINSLNQVAQGQANPL